MGEKGACLVVMYSNVSVLYVYCSDNAVCRGRVLSEAAVVNCEQKQPVRQQQQKELRKGVKKD